MFKLGRKSETELVGVHPNLVKVTRRALELTSVDFAVHDGIRSKEEQREYVRQGVSRTMNSKHLKQADSLGHAVDLVPVINGKLRWEWHPIYIITEAMRDAATELDVRIRWGGCWHTITYGVRSPEQLRNEYIEHRKRNGLTAFCDGPHFELAND